MLVAPQRDRGLGIGLLGGTEASSEGQRPPRRDRGLLGGTEASSEGQRPPRRDRGCGPCMHLLVCHRPNTKSSFLLIDQ